MKKDSVPANPARHLSVCVGVCGRKMFLSELFRERLGEERHCTLSFGDRCHSHIYFFDQSRCVSISLIFASHVLTLPEAAQPALRHMDRPKHRVLSADTLTELFFKCAQV